MQWFYFDALECLSESGEDIPEAGAQPIGSRYDGQIAIFGQDFQQKLERVKYFVVSGMCVRDPATLTSLGRCWCHWVRDTQKLCNDGGGG